MGKGSHHSNADPRNADIKININGELFHRDQAKVSVFDSGFILGDGVWEGLRLHQGELPFIQQHMQRLFEGAKALDMDIGISKDDLIQRILATCRANEMEDHVHIRLMVTRGVKATPYQDPRVTISSATIVIIPEYKMPSPDALDTGLDLYTVYVRRGYPDVQDQKLNSHSKLNCIFGCIQATKAGADEALMLDPHGFVATCNSTHFFIVRNNQVWTSTGDYCLSGITRANIIRLCEQHDIKVYQKNFTLSEVYGSDEAFVTGTFAGVTPVKSVDGRDIGDYPQRQGKGEMVARLQQLYQQMIVTDFG
ncbi:aminotransferase class IV [Thalassotalea sp. ND16A]|uniref:aminotransferase class IV n=1 Tax=Thalassotalea sp. ND16A TaxID=1535422 RepID=UPI000519F7F5|nr:aminotransferase class IV [Thalassotalea sp. ND16A]KGJ98012.1 D-amino-acid transaminase [Thalassotalea sp. ND16A]